MTPAILYAITCKVTGKLYVGITTQRLARRWKAHKVAAISNDRRYVGSVLHVAMRKHGRENFTIEPLFVYPSFEEAALAEIELIAHLHLTKLGYNASHGGEGVSRFGYRHTAETRAKIGAAHRGKKRSPESRERMSTAAKKRGAASFLGRTHTAEARLKISLSKIGKTPHNKGKPHSAETREKIRVRALARFARAKSSMAE